MLIQDNNHKIAPPIFTQDYEQILPIDLIRAHTKTEDIPAVDDLQLVLYRQAAIETCEEYLGYKLGESGTQRENVEVGFYAPYDAYTGIARKPYKDYVLRKRPTGGIAYLYGGPYDEPRTIHLTPGDARVRLPIPCSIPLNDCRPGSPGTMATVMYQSGDCGKIPAAVRVGCLKYIAHVIENPGDMVVTTTTSGGSSNSGQIDRTSDPAYSSGAIAMWRTVMPYAI